MMKIGSKDAVTFTENIIGVFPFYKRLEQRTVAWGLVID